MELAVTKTRPPESRDTHRNAVTQPRVIVALVGFMGAGKTTVGNTLAGRLGVPFVDLDQAIVEAAGGSPVAQLFREFGEVGFRARERAALRAVLNENMPMVLATGGGSFADPQMREWLLGRTRTVFLQAAPETVLKRLGDPDQRALRPLLRGTDPEKTVRKLLAERQEFYAQSEVTVITDGQQIDVIAENVMRALGLDRGMRARAAVAAPVVSAAPVREDRPMETVSREATVWSGAPHPVSYFDAADPAFARAVAESCTGRTVFVISDENVARLHLQALVANLRAVGKIVATHIVPPGEDSKRLSVVEHVYDAMQAAELDRDDTVVGLGGGVVGDLSGFAASTYVRGISCVQLPTSTLAAVDAALGGKTGVNTARAKNMVGTFSMPRAVFIARQYIMTQPKREHASGLAETVKMAATLDAQLFADVQANADALLNFEAAITERALRRSAQLKLQVVDADAREQNRRAILNYGHTIGHAIERGEEYRIPHGEAVALGMIAEAEWAETERLAPSGIVRALTDALESLGLPTAWREARVDVDALKLDKKRIGGSVRLPVITSIGTCELRQAPMSALTEYITRRSR